MKSDENMQVVVGEGALKPNVVVDIKASNMFVPRLVAGKERGREVSHYAPNFECWLRHCVIHL